MIDSFDKLICLNDDLNKEKYIPDYAKQFLKEQKQARGEVVGQKSYFFTKIEVGNSHAILMDNDN